MPTLTTLGDTYRGLGDHEKQRLAFERALRIEERVQGPAHFRVAITLDKLGGARASLGDHAEAAAAFERAARIQAENLGEPGCQDIDVAITSTNLALSKGMLGDRDKKRELLGNALAVFEAFEHPHAAFCKRHLARLSLEERPEERPSPTPKHRHAAGHKSSPTSKHRHRAPSPSPTHRKAPDQKPRSPRVAPAPDAPAAASVAA